MITYSDAYQDIFTLKLFNKNIGYYLDIGCSDGITKNNTLLLENKSWTGLLFDIDHNHINKAIKNRTAKAFAKDVSAPGVLFSILEEENCPKNIDYISLDIDEISLVCLQNFPLDLYRFKFLTFEHDIYANRKDCIERKNITPKLLSDYGYAKIADNVCWNGLPYEDWYVDMSFFDSNRFDKIINETNLSYKEIFNRLQ